MSEEVKCKRMRRLRSGEVWVFDKSCDCEKCVGKLALRKGIRQGQKEGVTQSLVALASVTFGLVCLRLSLGVGKFGLRCITVPLLDMVKHLKDE